VVAGQPYSIIDLALRKGELVITAFRIAPCDQAAVTDEPATIFGPDGCGVCQGWKVSIPRVKASGSVTIYLPIKIESVT
jgi:hypothetical protein